MQFRLQNHSAAALLLEFIADAHYFHKEDARLHSPLANVNKVP